MSAPNAPAIPPSAPGTVAGIPFAQFRALVAVTLGNTLVLHAQATVHRVAHESPTGKPDEIRAGLARITQAKHALTHEGGVAVLLDTTNARLEVLALYVDRGVVVRGHPSLQMTFINRLLETYALRGMPTPDSLCGVPSCGRRARWIDEKDAQGDIDVPQGHELLRRKGWDCECGWSDIQISSRSG